MTKKPQNFDTIAVRIAVMDEKMDSVKSDVTDIKEKMAASYATKEWVNAEYGLFRSMVTAFLYIFAVAIIGAFATFIIRGGLK